MPNLQKKIENLCENEFLLWLNSNKKISNILLESLIERSLLRTDLTKIKELERNEKIDKNLLKYLTVKVKKFDLDTNYFETKDKTSKIENKNNS